MAAAPKKEAASADESASKKKKMFMIIGLAVTLIAVSIGGTVFALKMLYPASASDESAKKASVLAPAIYHELTPNFTITFNVNGRQRYLQTAITVLYRDPKLLDQLTLHMPAIRNGLVMLLSSKNFDELQTEEGKETLRAEALDVIRGQLQKEREILVARGKGDKVSSANIEQVLFTNFVMQ